MSYRKPQRQGIELKKKHGQNFLKERSYIDRMIDAVYLDNRINVMEIGCGEGILTQGILQGPCKQLKVFEIDPEWADFVQNLYGSDKRLAVILQNVLDANWDLLTDQGPWVLLANLPYHVTFPILYKVYKYRQIFNEGVIMVQEEVAQKIVKSGGRDYGYTSLFFQHYFTWKLLDKVPPGAFFPPPKVFSRLVYFAPKKEVVAIKKEEEFWKFIKLCFGQPRRTLQNNLKTSHFDLTRLDQEILLKRGQQLSMEDLLNIWDILNK
jgi:16S rRNA (adenine1518-N6/adenine1519-N6)-dimethyltransferase